MVSVSVTSNGGVVTGDNPITHALLLLIIQMTLIIALSRCLALLLRPLRQPRVVAEILAGILLGPTAFGYIPGFSTKIFPDSSLTVLETLANMGLIFFLFLVGLELDLRSLSKTGKGALWMAFCGIVLPFSLGVVVSIIIFKVMRNDLHTSFGPFTVFIGVALSITAFPVLARILAERKLLTTELGQMAMSAAAVNDVVAWILLALAVAITNAGSSPIVALYVLLLGVAFLLFMFILVRPILHALAHYEDPIPELVVAITLVIVLGAAFVTDIIGIHVIFGAFICGLIVPKDGPFAGMLIEKIEDYVSILFLPLYFAYSGLQTQLSSINSGTAVGILALVLGTACLGKILGTVFVAKLVGMDTRKSFALGFLMNTKGLVELIVLNIGLQKGVRLLSICSSMHYFTISRLQFSTLDASKG